MTTYMLDTDAVSHWLRGEGRVAERLRETSPVAVCISTIVVQELELGVARRRSKRLRHALDTFYRGIDVAPYDEQAARRYGALAARLLERGTPIGVEDAMIAAHAMVRGDVLVTHNTKHFRRVRGLAVEDWY